MRRIHRKHILLGILALVILAVLVDVPGRIARRTIAKGATPCEMAPSPMPQIARTVALRFDPSFHYKGIRPSRLADDLADKWSRAGVNLVFYRTYDPRHGAFYRTSYRHNSEGEFGRYDLLGEVVEACHARRIQVFAWAPVMNHAGAWQANPQWREKTPDGQDYTATGLEFPLCARNPQAGEWWLGFIDDLLSNYPDLDGVDFGEPVVSWKADRACFCDLCCQAGEGKAPDERQALRAAPLTELLAQGVEKVRRAGKRSCVTFVQSAGTSGDLLSSREMRAITGFDLEGLLALPRQARPDIVCPEFIWQEWRSLYGENFGGDAIFTPEWVEGAVRRFYRRLDVPIEVIAHLEITDFPRAQVDAIDFRASLLAAVRGGAQGIDVYNASLLEEKGALGALKTLHRIAPVRSCLVLQTGEEGRGDAVQIGELLRHFHTTVDLMRVADYAAGGLERYDVVCYVGTKEGTALPLALADDIARYRGAFCWLGANIAYLLAHDAAAGRLGLRYVEKRTGAYDRVAYKGEELAKDDPATHVVEVLDNERCQVLAQTLGGNDASAPYAVRSGRNFWYFADVPPMFAIEGGRFLVFADLLHDIVGEDHRERRIAMIRIEDVNPMTDPNSLRALADYLHSRNVPFQVATVPFYVYPDKGVSLSMNEKPDFVKALRYMQEKGGAIVMHGITHQRFGETTADYEFFDHVADGPIEGQNEEVVRKKIEEGLREFWSANIFPLMWETPHYSGSQLLYGIIPDYFSMAMERRQAIDKHGTDQYFPYPLRRDRYGQVIMPENMGYVPLNRAVPEVITEPASKMHVVRDGVVSFFFHPFIDHAVLEGIVEDLQERGYRFASVAHEPIRVSAPFGIASNCDTLATIAAAGPAGRQYDLRFPGIVESSENLAPPRSGKLTFRIGGSGTDLQAAYFIERYKTAQQQADRNPADIEVNPFLLQTQDHSGERRKTPVVLLVESGHEAARIEGRAFLRAFRALGIRVRMATPEALEEIPDLVSLVVVPAATAKALTDSQTDGVVEALRQGDISLVTTGFSALSDELAIAKKDEELTVSSVRDTFYPDIPIHWHKPAQTYAFESPGDASFIYEDAASGRPIVVAATLGDGPYLFMSAPLTTSDDALARRYPYFMTHLFRSLGVFPMVRGKGYEIYFNPAERPEDLAVEDLVKQWRRMGVQSIYVAAWQVFAEWEYDYAHLIELAHSNAMLVYAWFEPPYVDEKFWQDHPQWRERNALGEEALIQWRKPMAFGDPDCFEAATEEMRRILEAHPWDGVVLNRLGWDAQGGADAPEAYTPFHPSARAQFEKAHGFDPIALFDERSAHYWKNDKAGLAEFEDWRAERARQVFQHLVRKIAAIGRTDHSDWEIILGHVTDNPLTGLTLTDYQALRKAQNCKLMRRAPIDSQWEPQPDLYDINALQITAAGNERASFHANAPTHYPTGLALYEILSEYITQDRRFALNSENSLYEIDTRSMPFLYAAPTRTIWTNQGLILVSSQSAEVAFWNKPAVENLAIDEALAGSYENGRLVVPIGEHRVSTQGMQIGPRGVESGARVVDCSADLVEAAPRSRGILVKYRSDRKAIVVLNQKPEDVVVDGVRRDVAIVKGIPGYALHLPAGSHRVEIATRSWFEAAMIWISLSLSRIIVAVSLLAACIMAVIFFIVHRQQHRAARRESA